MDALSRMSPMDYAYIIGAAVLVMLTQMAWGWREPIADYVTRLRQRVSPATATTTVAANAAEPLLPVAMPRNDVNAELSRNSGNVVLRSQADIIARLLRSDSLYRLRS